MSAKSAPETTDVINDTVETPETPEIERKTWTEPKWTAKSRHFVKKHAGKAIAYTAGIATGVAALVIANAASDDETPALEAAPSELVYDAELTYSDPTVTNVEVAEPVETN